MRARARRDPQDAEEVLSNEPHSIIFQQSVANVRTEANQADKTVWDLWADPTVGIYPEPHDPGVECPHLYKSMQWVQTRVEEIVCEKSR